MLQTKRLTTFDFSITVPCNFDTPISVYIGGKEIIVTPTSFNLGAISEDFNTCLAGAASSTALNGGKLAFDNVSGTTLTSVKTFGFSEMFSCRTLTVLGILVTAASVLLTLFESWYYSRSRRIVLVFFFLSLSRSLTGTFMV